MQLTRPRQAPPTGRAPTEDRPDGAAATTSDGPAPAEDRPGRVLAIVSVATFVAGLDLFIVNIAFPAIRADFPGTSDAGLSWVLSAYAIVFAALLVPTGRIADRVGHKRVFLVGLAVFVAASALCAAAPSVPALVVARALQAAGGAALMPTSLALLLSSFPAPRRPAAIAVWSASGAVAAAGGPPIGGLLVQLSWRWVFLVNLPVGLVTIAIAARLLAESRASAGRRPDLAGALVLVGAIGALTLAIVQAPRWGWADARTLAAFAAAAVGLGVFVRRCARHESPVVELDLLTVRSFAAANVASVLFFFAFGIMLLGGVLFLTGGWHEDVLTAGLQIAPGPVMAAVFALPSGALAGRFGARAVAVPGLLVYALGALWLRTHMGLAPHWAADYLPGMALGGAGVGMTIPTLAGAAAGSLPPARFATGSAVYAMGRQIGVALGVAVLVAIAGGAAGAALLASMHEAWELMIGCALAAAAVTLAIGPGPERAAVRVAAAPATGTQSA